MITWVRSAKVHDGKLLQAIEWGLKATAYVNETFGMNASMHRPVSGQLNQVQWVATYDSLASYEEVSGKVFADPGYQSLIAEANSQGLFRGDTVEDFLYQSLS